MKLKIIWFFLLLVSCKSFFTEPELEKEKYAQIKCQVIMEWNIIIKYRGIVEMKYGEETTIRYITNLRVDIDNNKFIYDVDFGEVKMTEGESSIGMSTMMRLFLMIIFIIILGLGLWWLFKVLGVR